jgi:sarcosine oxidase
MDYDVIIVGLGAVGSSAAYHLARQGQRVLGLDRFRPPHSLGSSHGRSRIIREAYFEHPLYVPLVQGAYARWADIERESNRRLLVTTGGLMLGHPEGTLVRGARTSAVTHGLAYEELGSDQIRRRFPAFHPDDDVAGIFEPRAGVLAPEECIGVMLDLAARRGAALHYDEPAEQWAVSGGEVTVRTKDASYRAGRLILAAGAWMAGELPGVRLHLLVERQVLFWFEPKEPEVFSADRCPIFIWEWEPDRYFYGFPDVGDGVKVALHHQGEPADPNAPRRAAGEDEEERIRGLLERFLPGANGPLLDSAVCLYTNSRDGHFLIDRHPRHPEVLLASPCSGHGFKFVSLLGELLAAMTLGQSVPYDLSPFRLR